MKFHGSNHNVLYARNTGTLCRLIVSRIKSCSERNSRTILLVFEKQNNRQASKRTRQLPGDRCGRERENVMFPELDRG